MKCVPEMPEFESSESIKAKVDKSSNEAWMDVVTESELTIDDEEECTTPEVSEFSTLDSDISFQKPAKDTKECVTPQQLVIDIDNLNKSYETESSRQYSEEENTLNFESSEHYPSSIMSTSWEEDEFAEDWEVYMDEENLDLESKSVLVPVPTDRPSITVNQAGTYANMLLT